MATRVALPLLYLCSLVLGVADAESGVASSSRALGSNASPASLPSTRGTRTPQSAGGRVTFAASASQEEPEWEYETPIRATARRHSPTGMDAVAGDLKSPPLLEVTLSKSPADKAKQQLQQQQTILITPRAAQRQMEEEASPSKATGASPVSSYSSESDMSPERIRISAKAAPQSAQKTPRTLERDAVFRTPNPKGLRYTLSSSSPRSQVTHKAPSPPHNRPVPSNVAGVAAYQKSQLEHLQSVTRTVKDSPKESGRPQIISRISLSGSTGASPTSKPPSSQPSKGGAGGAAKVDAKGATAKKGNAVTGVDVKGGGDLESRSEKLIKDLEETASKLDTLLRQVDAEAKGGDTEDEDCHNAVAPRREGSIAANLSPAWGRAKAFARDWGVGQGNAAFGMMATLSMSVLLAVVGTMVTGSKSFGWVTSAWQSVPAEHRARVIQTVAGGFAVAIQVLGGRVMANLITKGGGAASYF